MSVTILPADPAKHADAVWRIFQSVVQAGGSFVFPAGTSREDALAYWFAPQHRCYVAEDGGEVLGAYFIQPNQPGLGNHVANAAYMTAPEARGRGLGGLMCAHSLEEARQQGFLAMQYNIVVATNTGAVALWEKHGFRIIGTAPKVYRHPDLGLVDAHIMFREL
jgi:ribosomal protein S18 acetylase RimI-like enzyme